MPFDDKPYCQLSSKSDAAFEDMTKMLIFGPFLTLIPYNPGLKNFFQKSAWNIFYSYQDTTLCKVSEKSDARFSRYEV